MYCYDSANEADSRNRIRKYQDGLDDEGLTRDSIQMEDDENIPAPRMTAKEGAS